jgi:hypothetical protein
MNLLEKIDFVFFFIKEKFQLVETGDIIMFGIMHCFSGYALTVALAGEDSKSSPFDF